MNKLRMILAVLYIIVGLVYLADAKAAVWGPYMANPTNSNTVESGQSATVIPITSSGVISLNGDNYWTSTFSNMPRMADCTQFFTITEKAAYSDQKAVWSMSWSGLGANRLVALKINGGTEFTVKADATGTASYSSGIGYFGGTTVTYRAKRDTGVNTGVCPTSRPAFQFNHQCHAAWRPEYDTWYWSIGHAGMPGDPGWYPDPTLNVCN